MIFLAVVLGLILLVGGWAVLLYNSLIKGRNRVDEAWSDIDVQLKRRYDLIPNLVSTVKGYAKHEKETLENVIKARNKAMEITVEKGASMKDLQQVENQLSQTLKSLFALSESYPDLKANQNFLELQRELTDTEDKIQASRRFYNGNVRDFNIKIQTFPNNVLAGMFGFSKREMFEAVEAEKANIKVEF